MPDSALDMADQPIDPNRPSVQTRAFVVALVAEVQAMASYATSVGSKVPASAVASVVERLSDDDVSKLDLAALLRLHGQLVDIVHPARPDALVFMARAGSVGSWFGPTSLVRRLVAVTGLAMLLFVATSLSPSVNGEATTGSALSSAGLPLLLNYLFYISAAALGACFHALYDANKEIAERSFDPRHEPTYWVRVLLGVLSGLLLPALLAGLENGDVDLGYGRPVLALVGGFSAALFYRILSRLVEAVESLFRGSAEARIRDAESASRARSRQRQAEQEMAYAATLMELKSRLKAGEASEAVLAQVDSALMKLTPELAGSAASLSPPAPPDPPQ